MAIEEGKAAPTFTLKDQDGNKVALKDYRGKTVVVYFYPKDDTPGCTKEACGFRDHKKKFDKMDTVILGISPDAADSHIRFIDKFKLPFTLLSDPDKKVMEKYGAWGEKMMYGKKMIGVIRSTTIIDANGKVLKHWKKVPKAADHPAKVLEFLESQPG
ncbi:MAG: thioredoxin-dependent thiol peroxidase [Arenicellales bacterium]